MSTASRLAKLERSSARPNDCPGWDIVVLGDDEPIVPKLCGRCGRPNDHATIRRFIQEIVTVEDVHGAGQAELVGV